MSENEITDSVERTKPSKVVLLIAAVPIGAAIIQMAWIRATSVGANGGPNWTEIGARGDWWGGHFGAGAALTSAILFFYAVWLQHSELQETRKELRLARGVYEEQKHQLKRQADIAEKAAINSYILEIAEVRKPWLEAWCQSHEQDTMLNINRRGTLQDEMGACDRYIYDLLDSPLFTDGERQHIVDMLWLFGKDTIKKQDLGNDDALINIAVKHKIKTRAFVHDLLNNQRS